MNCLLSPALLQDVYPKGVIPLAAIQMARPAKDNKFEIVTSQRIFVFRADNEGKNLHYSFFRSRQTFDDIFIWQKTNKYINKQHNIVTVKTYQKLR